MDVYQEHIKEKVSKIRGVNVNFNQPYLGSWEGIYEPSLNMTLSISPNADTGAISGLLFDLAENTSQDAFILEERSEIEGRTPLTEFDEAGMMHYPQFRVIFDKQLSVAEKSIIAQRLKNNGVEEFSIDGDYFIVSIIDFNSETNEQRKKHYAEKTTTITTLFRGEGERVGTNRVRDVQKHIRKSKYVGARNEGDEQSQTREYDRSDLFETQSQNINFQINATEQETEQIKSATDNVGTFSSESNDIRYQETDLAHRAAVEFVSETQAVLHALESPNVSSLVHEFAHMFEQDLDDYDIEVLEEWSGFKRGSVEFRESVAEGFEAFMAEKPLNAKCGGGARPKKNHEKPRIANRRRNRRVSEAF